MNSQSNPTALSLPSLSQQFVMVINEPPKQRRTTRRPTNHRDQHLLEPRAFRLPGPISALASFASDLPTAWRKQRCHPPTPIKTTTRANTNEKIRAFFRCPRPACALPANSPVSMSPQASSVSATVMTDRAETPGRHPGDSRVTAGRHSEGSKNSYMDQCTFGAGPPARRAGSGPTAAIPELAR